MIKLTEDLYLGEGKHKTVYAHPEDKRLCIKILHRADDYDWAREMRYRRALGARADSMTLLTKYYGSVATDKGAGYLFERVLDYDGAQCVTLLSMIENRDALLEGILTDFKRAYFSEELILAGVDADNYLVQRVDKSARRVRVIDNIGMSATLPLAYYFGIIRRKRCRKYWQRFMEQLKEYGLRAEFISELSR